MACALAPADGSNFAESIATRDALLALA
jgi:hypothetical protein